MTALVLVYSVNYLEPSQMKTIPARIRARSRAFALRFFSWKISTPQIKDTITDPLRISETTEIMESSWFRAVRYEKSAAEMNMEISGIAQLQWNGVVVLR